MTQLHLPRRKFLTGAVAFLAAPAIVRAASLMPIKVEKFANTLDEYVEGFDTAVGYYRRIGNMIHIEGSVRLVTAGEHIDAGMIVSFFDGHGVRRVA